MTALCSTCGTKNVFYDAYVNVNDIRDVRIFDDVFCEICEKESRLSRIKNDHWVIISNSETNDAGILLYWSNEHGWVPYNQADHFTDAEQQNLTLPLTGSWLHVKI